jgi:predicted ATP-grasp superfamily ATP-dependent carboligase
MSDLMRMVTNHQEVELRSPILVAAFRGWNDAGDAASFAATHLGRTLAAEKIASIDPEEFYDFQAVRPEVRLVDGMTREINWPANEFWASRGHPEHDLLLFVGTEPNLKWRMFSELVVGMARKYGVRLVVTFGHCWPTWLTHAPSRSPEPPQIRPSWSGSASPVPDTRARRASWAC